MVQKQLWNEKCKQSSVSLIVFAIKCRCEVHALYLTAVFYVAHMFPGTKYMMKNNGNTYSKRLPLHVFVQTLTANAFTKHA